MPRTSQIIPQYDVPHVMTVINDNSTIDTIADVEVADPAVRGLCLFTSAKGPDGVRTLSRTQDYIKMYGTPDIKKYGQASYMPYLMLSTGNARVHCVRVTPADAAYANVVITAKSTTADSATTVTFATKNIENLTNLDEFATKVEALDGTLEDGEKVIMALVATGRGTYGNDMSFRLVPQTAAVTASSFKNYTLEILSRDNGLTLDESHRIAVFYNAIERRISRYAEDVINDPETGSVSTRIYVNTDNIKALYDAYATAAGESAVAEPMFDPFFGNYTGYTVATEGLNFGKTDGILFGAGTEGSFADSETRDKAIEDAYLAVLNTTTPDARYGRAPFSKRRTPSEIILDANFPISVKMALYELALKRTDAKLYLDCGTANNTIDELIAYDTTNFYDSTLGTSKFSSSEADVMDYLVTREGQWAKVRDPFTGKIIDVTYTWFLAQALPTHIITNGTHVPFIGERYSLLTGHIANSVRPNIDADDLESKQLLWEKRINTLDTLSENRYARSTQVTVQTDLSDLTEDSNVLVLLEMKRILEDITLKRLFDFADAEDRRRFTDEADRVFATYPNRKVREYKVSFDMNEYEQERNILHCYLTVIFRQISTRAIVEIDINRRTSTIE